MESPQRSSLDFQEQSRSEEVEAKRWMDRASRYLTEGRFEAAIQLLQKTENVFPNCKNLPELMAVTQVCYAATWRACHCARPYTRKLPDWYHVLKVDERADFETIKKRYRQQALLLHPDKNKHVNSEAAFKIITEAYACLSDKEKRDRFNLERRRSSCKSCNLKAQQRVAIHASRPVAQVHTPQASNPNDPSGTPKYWESESLQNLRERAQSTVQNLEREFGGKTAKWMNQLSSVRQRYWNPTDSPGAAELHSTMKPDPVTGAYEEHAPSRPKAPSSPVLQKNSISTSEPKSEFSSSENRRPSTCDVEDERSEKVEENLDVLLNRLRSERSAAVNVSPLTREFGVHTRTPEAGHLLRPLRDIKPSSSAVDNKCDAASLYSTSWMPKGRCLSKKAPLSPTRIRPATVHVDRTLPRTSCSEHRGQTTPMRSSSVRLESLYPTSPFHPIETHSRGHSATSVRPSSLRFEGLRRPSTFKKDENLPSKVADSATAGSTSSKLESLYPASPLLYDGGKYSKEMRSVTTGRSSSVRLESFRRTSTARKDEAPLFNEADATAPGRSSSVRLESFRRTSTARKDEAPLFNEADATAPGRSSSVRLESFRQPSMARKDETPLFKEADSTAPGRSSSVRLEDFNPAYPAKKDDVSYSQAADSDRSSSVGLDDVYRPSSNKEDYIKRFRSISRTTSGSWSNRVAAHPNLFDDPVATVSPSASRTLIQKQTSTYVLKSPAISSTSEVAKLLSEHRQKRAQRGNTPLKERITSLEKDVKLGSTAFSQSNAGVAENEPEGRLPLGSMDENSTSYSSKIPGMNFKMTSKSDKESRASQLMQVEIIEKKQKADAINEILERLRAEAKTVAATLDGLRDNVGA